MRIINNIYLLKVALSLLLGLLALNLIMPMDLVNAQADSVGKLYLVTYAPVTEENRRLGQTATISEVDPTTGSSRSLLTVEPYITQSPRALFSQHELSVFQEAIGTLFPPDSLDRPLLGQGIERVVLLDEEHLLVIIYCEARHADGVAYGYYDLLVLNLQDGSSTSMMTLEYHPTFIEQSWGCTTVTRVIFGKFSPNPTSDILAFSVVPDDERWCGDGFTGQVYLVNYTSLPVQTEIIPFAREFDWSPDGSLLAYTGVPCTHYSIAGCFSSYYVRSSSMGSPATTIAQYAPSQNYPDALITWLDNQTIVYQYVDVSTNSYQARWRGYDIVTGQEIFSEFLQTDELRHAGYLDLGYLHNSTAHLIYRDNRPGLVLMQYTDNHELVEMQTLSTGYIFNESKFRQYAVLRESESPVLQILNADTSISSVDLSPFILPGHTLRWVILGSPHYPSQIHTDF